MPEMLTGLCIEGHWIGVHEGDSRVMELYRRHYSCRNQHPQQERLGPGEKMVLVTSDCLAGWVWLKQFHFWRPWEQGLYCSIFRNEGPALSSTLILEAEGLGWQRWPGQRLFTYVDPKKVKSSNPGCCFKKAGWKHCGRTKKGLMIFEKLPQAESRDARRDG